MLNYDHKDECILNNKNTHASFPRVLASSRLLRLTCPCSADPPIMLILIWLLVTVMINENKNDNATNSNENDDNNNDNNDTQVRRLAEDSRGLPKIARKQSAVERVRWPLSELWTFHDGFIFRQYFVQQYSASLLKVGRNAEASGWRSTDGSLIQTCWLRNIISGASVYWQMCKTRRGTVSSNSRFQTVLFQQ